MGPPDATRIDAAVAAQRDLARTLFDQLRQDGIDDPGVTRTRTARGSNARTPRWPRPQGNSA